MQLSFLKIFFTVFIIYGITVLGALVVPLGHLRRPNLDFLWYDNDLLSPAVHATAAKCTRISEHEHVQLINFRGRYNPRPENGQAGSRIEILQK